MPHSIVLPSLKSGLVLVVLAAMVAFGLGRLHQMPADLSPDTETRRAGGQQIITAPTELDVLAGPSSMSALDSESVPELSSGWTPPAKRPLPPRRSRSPRRGGPSSPMAAGWPHSTIRPEKQLPVPADARSAMSGEPVGVFAVLRN